MSDIVFLKGPRVHLRALMEQDLTSVYLQWLNDEEVCRSNSHAIFPNTEQKMKVYFESLKNGTPQVVLAIIHTETGRHIGNVSLQSINWISRSAEFAILLGEKEFWRGGYGEEAAKLIVEYGFNRLNLHRIYCGTFDDNEGMRKLAAKLKMKEEGIRREAVYKSGTYHNVIEFGVLKSEYYS
jgi:[ribosomal protein S5]-alanine N-acetyltransferase